MNRVTKPTLLALAATGVLTVGGLSLAGVGSAAADGTAASLNAAVSPVDPTDPADSADTTGTVDTSTDPAAGPTAPGGNDGRPGHGRRGNGCDNDGAGRGAVRRSGPMLDAVAEAIGIEVADLRTALADGQTIAEVATANGVDPSVVVDAIVAVRAERLAQAVENGRLTQEEADSRLAEQTAKIEAHINGTDDAVATTDSAPVTGDTTA